MGGNHPTYPTYLHRLAKDFPVAFRFPLSCLRRGGRRWGRRVVVRTDCQATPKDGVRLTRRIQTDLVSLAQFRTTACSLPSCHFCCLKLVWTEQVAITSGSINRYRHRRH